MKRRLELNHFGPRAILVLLASAGLSGLLRLATAFFERMGFPTAWLLAGSRLFLWVTALLFGLFLLLLIGEGIQDAVYDARYRKNLGKRLPGPEGYGECPFCGSWRVRSFDRDCPVCGKMLG